MAVGIVDPGDHRRVMGSLGSFIAISEMGMAPQDAGKLGQRKSNVALAQVCIDGISRSDRMCLAPHAPQCSPFTLIRRRWTMREQEPWSAWKAAVQAALPMAV